MGCGLDTAYSLIWFYMEIDLQSGFSNVRSRSGIPCVGPSRAVVRRKAQPLLATANCGDLSYFSGV